MKPITSWLFCAIATVFAGCASLSEPEIRVRHTHRWTYGTNVTVALAPSDTGKVGTVEYDGYIEYTRMALRARGFAVTNVDSADHIAFLEFTTEPVLQQSRQPVYGDVGGGLTTHQGTVTGAGWAADYTGSSYTPPTRTMVGTADVSRFYVFYGFRLVIYANRGSDDGTAYEEYAGTASTLLREQVDGMILRLVDAVVETFPGRSGQRFVWHPSRVHR